MAETVPGGLTISAAGYWQNADGEYVDEKGKRVDEPVYVQGQSPRSGDVEPGQSMTEKAPTKAEKATR